MKDGTVAEEPAALEGIEEAMVLLKRLGLGAYWAFAAGTAFFLWALLYYWAYMSRNALASTRLSEFALLLALAYAAMKAGHAHFFRSLMAELHGEPSARAGAGWWGKAILFQALLQPISLFLIPLALILTLPYPFVSSFFRNALWVREEDGFATWLGRSAALARLWPRQNAYQQIFLAGAWIVLAGNVFSALVTGPILLKSLLGVETVFSRSQAAFLNTTVMLMVWAIAWGLLEPLAQAVQAWRCFRGLSLRTGADLSLALGRARSRRLPATRTATAIGLIILALSAAGPAFAGSSPAKLSPAKPSPTMATPIVSVPPERLDRLLREEIAESRYGWRLPRHAADSGSRSWTWTQVKKALHAMATVIRKMANLFRRFADWFNALFNRHDKSWRSGEPAASSPVPIRILMLILAVTFAAGLAVLLMRRARAVPSLVAAPIAPTAPLAPDASSEDVKADDFPEDEWLRLMETLRAQGDDRLALRALFLAMLSLLSRKGWLVVARHKSNRDYAHEVSARARRRPAVAESFRENIRRFDRVWYGRHQVSGEDWVVSQGNFAEVRRQDA